MYTYIYIYIYIYMYIGLKRRSLPSAELVTPVTLHSGSRRRADDNDNNDKYMVVILTLMIILITNNGLHDNTNNVTTTNTNNNVWMWRRVGNKPASTSGKDSGTANLHTKILDFRRFDSSTILSLRGGIPRSIGHFSDTLSQGILVSLRRDNLREIGRKDRSDLWPRLPQCLSPWGPYRGP